MMQRHNAIQLRVIEAIMNHREMNRAEINENKAITMKEGLGELKDISLEQFAKLRHDVWFWTRENDIRFQEVWNIYIIELSISFGKPMIKYHRTH
jgi:hypothetical protein